MYITRGRESSDVRLAVTTATERGRRLSTRRVVTSAIQQSEQLQQSAPRQNTAGTRV